MPYVTKFDPIGAALCDTLLKAEYSDRRWRTLRKYRSRVDCDIADGKPEKKSYKQTQEKLWNFATDAEVLYCATRLIAAKGPKAPGPSGLCLECLEQQDLNDFCKSMMHDLRDGFYRVGNRTRLEIPKDPDDPARGTRVIWIPEFADQVIQKAITLIAGQVIESKLGDDVVGFRKGRDRFHALARLSNYIKKGHLHLFACDIRNAYDNVRFDPLNAALARWITDPKLVAHMLDQVRQPGRKGIIAGGSLSPYMLNAVLGYHLDFPWRQEFPSIPMLRYADDLLLCSRSQAELAACQTPLRNRLRGIGMELKEGQGEFEAIDLGRAGRTLNWLGFVVSLDDSKTTIYQIAPSEWKRLERGLAECYRFSGAQLRANSLLRSWLDSRGPCYASSDRKKVLERLLVKAAEHGFEETPSEAQLMETWQSAHDRWLKLVRATKPHKRSKLKQRSSRPA